MIIDLSLSLTDGMPVYPGDPELVVQTAADFENDHYLGHSIVMGSHTGTHIDAPAHMIENSKTLSMFPIDTFVGRGKYVAVREGEYSLDEVQKSGIQEGDIVLFNTGMSSNYKDPSYFKDFPVMSEEIANYLVERKVKMVGVDTCSIDNQSHFPIHKILLGSDILIIENLVNLEQLSSLDSIIYALPLKFNLDAAPARVVAEVR